MASYLLRKTPVRHPSTVLGVFLDDMLVYTANMHMDEELTNHIIAKLILHHQLQWARPIAVQGSQLTDNGTALFISAIDDALLNHV